MAKQSQSRNPRSFNTPQAPQKVVDRNLMKINPKQEQFEPTPAMPMRQRQRMGGAG